MAFVEFGEVLAQGRGAGNGKRRRPPRRSRILWNDDPVEPASARTASTGHRLPSRRKRATREPTPSAR